MVEQRAQTASSSVPTTFDFDSCDSALTDAYSVVEIERKLGSFYDELVDKTVQESNWYHDYVKSAMPALSLQSRLPKWEQIMVC